MTVTVQGWDSGRQCDAFIAGAAGSGYRRAVDQDSTLMCRVTQGQDTFTVRDRGALKVYGNAVCAKLSSGTTPKG